MSAAPRFWNSIELPAGRQSPPPGTLVPPRGYLERLREIRSQYGILLVFDEVITGFGRTGKAFAGHSFNIVPDLMTIAKALTNGAQPMGAVAVKSS